MESSDEINGVDWDDNSVDEYIANFSFGDPQPRVSISQQPLMDFGEEDSIDHYMANYVFEEPASHDHSYAATPPVKRARLSQDGGANDAFVIHDDQPIFNMQPRGRRAFYNVADEHFYAVEFNERWRGQNIKDVWQGLEQMFQQLLDHIGNDARPQDLVRIHIHHQDLQGGDIKVSVRQLAELNPNVIMSRIEEVMQSKTTLSVDESLEVGVGVIHIPHGSGRTKVTRVKGPHSDLDSKKSIIKIVNTDQICMARAIVCCLAREQFKAKLITEAEYRQTCRDSTTQKEKAEELHRLAHVPTNRPCTLNDVSSFERALDIQIIVVSNTRSNQVVYTGIENAHKIYLYHVKIDEDHHFHSITKIKGFLGNVYFCDKCLRGFDHKKNTSVIIHVQNASQKIVKMETLWCVMTAMSRLNLRPAMTDTKPQHPNPSQYVKHTGSAQDARLIWRQKSDHLSFINATNGCASAVIIML